MSETLPQLYLQTAETLKRIEREDIQVVQGKDALADHWQNHSVRHHLETVQQTGLPFWNFLRIRPAETPKSTHEPYSLANQIVGDVFCMKGQPKGEGIRSMCTRQDNTTAFLAVGRVGYDMLLRDWERMDGSPAGKRVEEGQ